MRLSIIVTIETDDELFPVGSATDVLYGLLEKLEALDKIERELRNQLPKVLAEVGDRASLSCKIKEM